MLQMPENAWHSMRANSSDNTERPGGECLHKPPGYGISMDRNGRMSDRLRIWFFIVPAAAAAFLFRKELLLIARLALGACTAAFVLDPLVNAFSKRIPRPRAALLAMLIGAGGLLGAIFLLFPPLAKQFSDLIASLPAIIERLNGLIGRLNAFLTERGLSRISLSGLDWRKLSDSLSSLWTGTARVFGSVAGGVSSTVMSGILAYYFLAEKEAVLLHLEMLFPCRWRRSLGRMACAVRDELRSYLRGLGLVCLCVGALSAIAFALIGVQGALALGLLVGIANCIPYFGPFIGGIPAVICALTGGLGQAALALGAIVLVQQIDNMLITPRITGGATGLPPPAVMLSVLVGGSAFGWAGMLLAIPAVCTLRSILRICISERLPARQTRP